MLVNGAGTIECWFLKTYACDTTANQCAILKFSRTIHSTVHYFNAQFVSD